MKKFLLSGLAVTGLLLAVPDTVQAHGGQYRGPGDVVPPNPGGGGGRTPGPSGPSTPGPGGPGTPGPGGPSTPGPAGPGTGGPAAPGGGGGPTTGGVQLGDDLTKWQFWWEFNKDPFINLREAVFKQGTVTNSEEFFMGPGRQNVSKDTLKPTDAQILNEILPALQRTLESSDQRDIVSSCLIAMAKIGRDNDQIKILPIFKENLTRAVQEVQESAAVAMGISQMPEAVPDLVELAKNTSKGQEMVGGGEVNDRTRAFAAFGLGLVGYATSDNDVKLQIHKALDEILKDEASSNRNIRVPVINALGLLRPDVSDEQGKQVFVAAINSLRDYWNEKLGTGEQLIQSHVPPAIAKLFEVVDVDDEANADLVALKNEFKQTFLDEVTEKARFKREQITIVQSAIVALGRLSGPYDDEKDTDDPLDVKVCEALLDYSQKGKDQQARYFAMMALGQAGGVQNRENLLKMLEKGGKALEKPWAAISLGVLAYNENKAMEDAGRSGVVDSTLGERLQYWLGELKNPEAVGAMAVALGLAKYADAGDQLRELLEKEKNKDELAGYICIGLALMNDQRSLEQISRLVSESVRRPARLQQAAIALGKLGDKNAANTLVEMMTSGDQNLAKMSAIASALGFIGDRRTVTPLIKVMSDESLPDISRAFGAVALGGVAMQELLPWNTKIGINSNYRAAVETLTNQISGILDIL